MQDENILSKLEGFEFKVRCIKSKKLDVTLWVTDTFIEVELNAISKKKGEYAYFIKETEEKEKTIDDLKIALEKYKETKNKEVFSDIGFILCDI